MGELKNKRHEMFCRYYVTEVNGLLFNGSGSAAMAGYSKNTSAGQASRLLTNANIRRRIDELKKNAIDKLELNQLLALSKLKKIITDDISNYMSWKSTAEEYEDFMTGNKELRHDVDIDVFDSKTIDTWNISEISKGKDGQFKIKLHPKDKAVDKLMEYLKMFEPDDPKHNMAPVVIVNDLPGGDD